MKTTVACTGFAIVLAASCIACDAKQLNPTIEKTDPMAACAGIDCGAHGRCGVVNGSTAVCLCDEGYHDLGLQCVAAAVDAGTDAGVDLCAVMACAPHGVCAVVLGEEAQCICDDGYFWQGRTCLNQRTGQLCYGVVCGGHGTCQIVGDSESCVCDQGYESVSPVGCAPTASNRVEGGWAFANAAGDQTWAVVDDGTLWLWGYNSYTPQGHLTLPWRISSENGWASVSNGDGNGCAVKKNGTLWCWGEIDTDTTGGPVPVQIGTDTNWAAVSEMTIHACALKTDGTLWCWGAKDGCGALGEGPARVGTDADWAEVVVGDDHTCTRKTGGTIWCRGQTGAGLGFETSGEELICTPRQVGTDADWRSFAVGGGTCAVKAGGSLWCWGMLMDQSVAKTPVRIGDGTDWKAVALGDAHTCAIKSDGSVWCWGDNTYGQIGDGEQKQASRTAPARVKLDVPAIEVSAGHLHTCVRTEEGRLFCWGSNNSGQVGAGVDALYTGSRMFTPVEVFRAIQ